MTKTLISFIVLLVMFHLGGCALTPPVQEMSNARQTIAAAHEVKATIYAPARIAEAERLMTEATGALELGDYLSARDLALAAQQQAIKARQQSISKQNN